jgi:hypothetical protein
VVVAGGGVVVVGGAVVGGAVVGGAVVGGAVVGGGDVTGVDLVTGGAVVEVELAAPVPMAVVGIADVAGVVGVVAPAPEDGVVEVDFGADDFPSERTANQALSTPCPVASPFLVSLTKR